MSHLSVKEDRRDLINAHFEACKRKQVPYVLCLRRRTKADVEFDHISFEKDVDHILEQRAQEIRESAVEIFTRHKTKGSSFVISAHVMSMRGLKIESAELAAADLYKMICDAIAAKD